VEQGSMKAPQTSTIGRQRGVVLFIALIVMVAMSLAAIALIRSVDTTNILIGNLAFRQSSILPANMAVEEAAAALFPEAAPTGVPAIADTTADLPAENYFASWQNSDDARGVPTLLQTRTNAAALTKTLDAQDNSNANVAVANRTVVRYMIERMCLAAGPAKASNCDMMPPKQNPGTTVHDESTATLSPIPFYRVTIRVDGPQNTASFLQAMLR
jgi:type IV pilus assembly protein PilX